MSSENPVTRVQLIAGGDVMLGRQMPGRVALHGIDAPFGRLAPVLKAADLVMVNLETVIGVAGDFIDKGGRQPYYYHAPPQMLNVLAVAGIACVATANNHAMDYGPQALVEQCDALDAAGFVHAGSGPTRAQAMQPACVRVKGLTLAFISVETETPCMQASDSAPGVFHVPVAGLAQALAVPIAAAREQADIVIVTPHWGANWLEGPDDEIRQAARDLIDLGADAILGHSAHILHGIELHAGCPILYDMGTLLFDRVAQSRMSDSAMFELELDAAGVRNVSIHPVRLTEGEAHPAQDDDAARIRALMIRLSHELDPRLEFERIGAGLGVVCSPRRSEMPRTNAIADTPPPVLLDSAYGQRSHLVYDTMPVDCGWTSTVAVNAELEILGARFASPVRPNHGFVCEVWFRASAPPMSSRVEARLVGLDADGEVAFAYTHPVAEGIHPTARWNRTEVICDRVLVRPGKVVPDGRYALHWQLIDQEKRAAMQVTGAHERLKDGRIFIGHVDVSVGAPKGVAGIAPALRLERADAAHAYRAWQANPVRFWNGQACGWAAKALARLGVTPDSSTASIVRNTPWGLVVSQMTDKGRVYFKASSQANRFEPRLLAELSARWPRQVPRPLAMQPTAGWMMTPNYGRTLLDIHGKATTPDMWQRALSALAEIQLAACHNVEGWLALGVPDRRLQTLPDQLARLLDDDAALAIDTPNIADGLSQAEQTAARAMLPFFAEVCLALSRQPCSASLDQGDLHMGNIILRQEQCLFIDWGDATVAHPFGVLLLAWHRSRQRSAKTLAQLDELALPYLHAWQPAMGLEIEALKHTLHQALWVAEVNRALNWAHYATLDEATPAGNTRLLAARWIRFWLEDAALLTGRPTTQTPPPTALASRENPLLLSLDAMAQVTGGEWHKLPVDTVLTGLCHSRTYLRNHSQGNLYFPLNTNASDLSFTATNVAAVIKARPLGAIAAVVPQDAAGLPESVPLLHVPGDIVTALEALGRHVRDHLFTGTRVIVTGTEGKTGFKCMLHHVLSPQIPTHAMLNSTNLDHSIHASLASIRANDRITILEAAGTHPGRCKRRSRIVKPHVFVITEVGNEHINSHGSQQAVIEGKADICLGLQEGGYGLLNADSRNFEATLAAVRRRSSAPLLLFGSAPHCQGQLLASRFEHNGWQVQARIQGIAVDYRVPLLGEHAPLASVSVLLAAHALGADVIQAAAALASFIPYESSGVLRRVAVRGGEIQVFDHSTRASVLSYQSALATAARLESPQPGGRKIGLIGQMIFLGDEAPREHAELAQWIEAAGFDCLIFVGPHMEAAYARLTQPSRVVKRFPDYDRRTSSKAELKALIDALIDLVKPGDLVFVKGEVDEVGEHLRGLEIKP
jgi:UDP-N-acetylmuramyl pentapeptide synthase/poly-gamma-glutamate capsule biosynthesis protein CapA/YwtB (metallophosphatase superfamily)